jgi:rhodanese-related sulfurtransferase
LKDGFDSWKNSGKDVDSLNRISATDLEQQYKNKDVKIFDVRKKSEFDSEHVIDAINVPLNEINKHLAQFPKNEPFIIHCAGGYRSMIAASILKQRGWDDFVDVVGGFKEIAETSVDTSDYVCPTTLL